MEAVIRHINKPEEYQSFYGRIFTDMESEEEIESIRKNLKDIQAKDIEDEQKNWEVFPEIDYGVRYGNKSQRKY